MISDNIISSSFIVETVQRDLHNIYNTQLLIATKKHLFRRKRLENKGQVW